MFSSRTLSLRSISALRARKLRPILVSMSDIEPAKCGLFLKGCIRLVPLKSINTNDKSDGENFNISESNHVCAISVFPDPGIPATTPITPCFFSWISNSNRRSFSPIPIGTEIDLNVQAWDQFAARLIWSTFLTPIPSKKVTILGIGVFPADSSSFIDSIDLENRSRGYSALSGTNSVFSSCDCLL